MGSEKSNLPQSTLDLLNLKTVALGPVHDCAIAQRLQQIAGDLVRFEANWREIEAGREAKLYRLTRSSRAQLEAGSAGWKRLSEALGLILSPVEGGV
jgi:PadR family transcriptional regulator, regulatory protein PadR